MLDGLDCTGSGGVTENNSRGRADDSTSRAENRVSSLSLSLSRRFNYGNQGSEKISSLLEIDRAQPSIVPRGYYFDRQTFLVLYICVCVCGYSTSVENDRFDEERNFAP